MPGGWRPSGCSHSWARTGSPPPPRPLARPFALRDPPASSEGGSEMTRPDVLVTRPIMDAPLQRLRERCEVTVHENEFGIPREELLEVVAGREAIVTMLTEKVDAEFLGGAGPQLKIVANHAVGFDNVDLEACTAAGVLASNTPDVLTETTADTAFALIMAGGRRVGGGERVPRAPAPTDRG